MNLSTKRLAEILEFKFPSTVTSWKDATDEVRDMSRICRQIRGISGENAVDFRSIQTPGEWNDRGVASVVHHYDRMDAAEKSTFYSYFRDWIHSWAAAQHKALVKA